MSSVLRFDEWQDSNGVPVLNGAGGGLALGKILQVVSTTKTDGNFTTTSSSFTTITGLSASITPTAATSKILVVASITGGTDTATQAYFELFRGSAVVVGDAAGSRVRATTQIGLNSSNSQQSSTITFLDSPATTSSITYDIRTRTQGAGTVFINRSHADENSANSGRTISTLTLMEVAG